MLNDAAPSDFDTPASRGDAGAPQPYNTPVYKGSVAADLAAIFADAPSAPSAPPAAEIKSVRLTRRKPKPSLIAWSICGALAAALGLSGGLILLKHTGPVTFATLAHPQSASVLFSNTPAPSAAPRVNDKPVEAMVAYAPPPPAALPPTAALVNPIAPASQPSAFDIQSLAKARLRAVSKRNPKVSCEHDDQSEACRAYVLSSDQHLRQTYDKAFHAGVTHEVLVEYRDRWNDLRDRFSSKPEALAAGYADLAADLRAEAEFARTGRKPSRLTRHDDDE